MKQFHFILFVYQLTGAISGCHAAFHASSPLALPRSYRQNKIITSATGHYPTSAFEKYRGGDTFAATKTNDDGITASYENENLDVDKKRTFVSRLFSPVSSLQEGQQNTYLAHAAVLPVAGMFRVLLRELRALSLNQKFLFLGTFLLGIALGRIRPFWKRYTAVIDIPASYIGSTGSALTGRAVSVTDGDTIRFLHQPTPFHPSALRKEKKEKLSDTALPIRLCTIDTPETAKFGKPGQPFGIEAKEHLKELIENKVVQIQILQTDQYGRAVAQVSVAGGLPIPFLRKRKYMDAEMLKAGLAEVYQGGGAVYGPEGKDKYLEMEAEAKKKKLGIWSQKNRESAAEFKKRTKS